MKKYLSSLMLVLLILSMNITPVYAAVAALEEYSSVNAESNILVFQYYGRYRYCSKDTTRCVLFSGGFENY